jgi:hypothetical protein
MVTVEAAWCWLLLADTISSRVGCLLEHDKTACLRAASSKSFVFKSLLTCYVCADLETVVPYGVAYLVPYGVLQVAVFSRTWPGRWGKPSAQQAEPR